MASRITLFSLIKVGSLLSSIILFGCMRIDSNLGEGTIAKAEIKNINGGFQLYVNGKPFYINGAGLEFGSIKKLAEYGGNSFRTWRTDNGRRSGKEVLDEAQQYGLKVTMGIEIGLERHGFDYNNEAAVKAQFERIKKEVLELKDHPALIIWNIGNELNLSATNPKVWHAVNDISKMIHQVDPNHLTTTSLSGINKDLVIEIKRYAPDLDLLCVQLYAQIEDLPSLISTSGWSGPYIVTEWGATGHWEVANTAWAAPIENNSSVKASLYNKRYEMAISSQKKQCVGSYVFLWEQKQERTPTWYGLFLKDGTETESIDVMHYLWNGTWPENQSPHILSYTLDGKVATDNIKLISGNQYGAQLLLSDPENDPITYRWEIMKESKAREEGGDPETVPDVIPGLIKEPIGNTINFIVPEEVGAYRLFVYAHDDHNHAAHANIPFYVIVP